MLIIRDNQIRKLEQTTRKPFEHQMLKHMAAFAPKLYESSGEGVFKEVVNLGVSRAEFYGFTNRGPARFYIESMFTLGCMFDTDPQYPWVGTLLNDTNEQDQMQRADQLYDKMSEYCSAAIGLENEYANTAFQRLSNSGPDLLSLFGTKTAMLSMIQQYYPEKAHFVGNDALTMLIEKADDIALEQGIVSPNGVALIYLLMVIFGHDVVHDPLYPWLKRNLDNSQLVPEVERVNNLSKEAWSYFLEY